MIKIRLKHPPFNAFKCYVDDTLLKAKFRKITECEFQFESPQLTHTIRIVKKNIYSSWLAYLNIFNIFLFFLNWKFSTTRNLRCDEKYISASYTIKKHCENGNIQIIIHNKEHWDEDYFIGNSLEARILALDGVDMLNSRGEKMPLKDIKRWKIVNIASAIFSTLLILCCLCFSAFYIGFEIWTIIVALFCIIYVTLFSIRIIKAKPFFR